MSADVLSSRAIIGRFYHQLQASTAVAMALRIGRVFQSDQASEEYKWIGQVPALSEWKGGRLKTYLRDFGLTIRNIHYEASVAFAVKDLRRDKTGQINARIDNLAVRANTHWNSLVSALVIAGESTVCYDGQYFFDTDHVEGDSGSQSNDISVDISTVPASVHGTTTLPSVEEAAAVIMALHAQLLSFKDDRGEPMNEEAMEFELLTPSPLFSVFNNAVTMAVFPNGGSNPVSGLKVRVTMDARSTWTTKVALFRTDAPGAAAIILQEDGGVSMKVKGAGSDHEFDTDEHVYGVDAWRGAGYGLWQYAVLATMT